MHHKKTPGPLIKHTAKVHYVSISVTQENAPGQSVNVYKIKKKVDFLSGDRENSGK